MIYEVTFYYSNSSCDEAVPQSVEVHPANDSCTAQSCQVNFANTTTLCTADYRRYVKDPFDGAAYLLREKYAYDNCTSLEYAAVHPLAGGCRDDGRGMNYIARTAPNGSASIGFFYSNDTKCQSSMGVLGVDKADLEANKCVERRRWYIGNAAALNASASGSSGSSVDAGISTTSNGGLGTPALVGIIVGCVVILVLVALVVSKRASRSATKQNQQTASMNSADDTPRGRSGMWDDEVITAKRFPRNQISIQNLLSRGAFGEVYAGVFDSQQVAVKMLLPSMCGDLRHVNAFLAEARMTAVMDHPRIVGFVGVAWSSLSDLCVVLEFMDGGDLRTLLDTYEADKRPTGFDEHKLSIALHVCHALTYLHSLAPPVMHRDLKSRNILLSASLEAKLTDFGISRERLDSTMTSGVGTSLWMAPEVMLGERYNEKADLFSFGVVLSELDWHCLPYKQAKGVGKSSSNQSDAAMLQQVTMGKLRIQFSDATPPAIADLGYTCVALSPEQRPSAALYILQVALTQARL